MESDSRTSGYQADLKTIEVDLRTYQVLLFFDNRKDPLVIHFDKPARRFYLALIALIVQQMKRLDKPDFIYIRKFEKNLKLLDHALAGKNSSKTIKGMWDKIRKAWRYTLPDLQPGALFKVLDRALISPYEKGGRYRYDCSDEECDIWANLFAYDENNPWRLKFAMDSLSLELTDISLKFGELRDAAAWQGFLEKLNSRPKVQNNTKISTVSRPRKNILLGTASAIFVMISLTLGSYYLRFPTPTIESNLAEGHSIVVLPFVNMSGDQNQEYFCDGITDDLITDLSKISNLLVIARNSSFVYKGKSIKVQELAKELGVRYVLEGSVRKLASQIRINTQLIDATTGHHLWAGRYDREAEGIFALQDGITKEIVTALNVELTLGEQARVFARNTKNLEAYLLFLKAVHQHRKTHREGNGLARKLCDQAIALDPTFADPYRILAWTHLWDMWFGWSDSPKESFSKAIEMAEKSLSLDADNPGTVALLGQLSLLKRQHDKAIHEGEKSISLDPNSANNYMLLAASLRFAGRAAEGIPLLKKAIRLEPHTPANFYYQLGMAYNLTGQYEEAIGALKKGLQRSPDHLLSLIGLTIAYSLADKMKKAKATAAEVLRVNPKLSVTALEKKAPYKRKKDLELSMGAMRKAGLK